MRPCCLPMEYFSRALAKKPFSGTGADDDPSGCWARGRSVVEKTRMRLLRAVPALELTRPIAPLSAKERSALRAAAMVVYRKMWCVDYLFPSGRVKCLAKEIGRTQSALSSSTTRVASRKCKHESYYDRLCVYQYIIARTWGWHSWLLVCIIIYIIYYL